MLSMAEPGATFLLNSPYPLDQVWDHLPIEVQQQIIDKKLKFYAIDAYHVARETQMGVRINTIMQTCFFKLAGVIPPDDAIARIKDAIKKTYGKKGGEKVIEQNNAAVDAALAALHEVKYPQQATSKVKMLPAVPANAPAFVKDVLGVMIANRGDDLPVSAMPCDGTFPTGTTQYEKRSIAQDIPIWDPTICTQCGLCSLGCPHATIRMKAVDPALLAGAPPTLQDDRLQGQGVPRLEVHRSGCPGRLHRLRPVRRRLPGQGQGEGQAQGDRHGAAVAAPADRAGQFRLLPLPARRRPLGGEGRHDQGLAALAAAVRVLGRLRRLRRNALHQAAYAVLRRPHVDRQRDRLLVDLRRQSALHALLAKSRRPRAVLVELAVRGLRRVRTRLPPGRRSAVGLRQGVARAAVVAVGRRAGRRLDRTTCKRPRPSLPRSGPAWPS